MAEWQEVASEAPRLVRQARGQIPGELATTVCRRSACLIPRTEPSPVDAARGDSPLPLDVSVRALRSSVDPRCPERRRAIRIATQVPRSTLGRVALSTSMSADGRSHAPGESALGPLTPSPGRNTPHGRCSSATAEPEWRCPAISGSREEGAKTNDCHVR